MSTPDDNFDLDAFDAIVAAAFGSPLGDESVSGDAPEPGTLPEPEPVPAVRRVLAMVLTPLADAETLARLMGLVKITWAVFPTSSGAVAATYVEADELSELTGQPPAEADKVARALSQTSTYGVVLLTASVGENEEGTAGQVRGFRYVGGAQTEPVAPGLVLNGADELVEKVIFGTTEISTIPGVLDPAEVATWPTPPPVPPQGKGRRGWGRKKD